MPEHDFSKERLKELQALPLERKVGFTAARITEWYNHYNGKVYVSFSGGKDSTVLLHIARTLFPDIKAVFVDTGLEYPEIKEFVKTFDNVDIIRPKKSFLQVIEEYGYPVISKEVAQCVYKARRVPTGFEAIRLGIHTPTEDSPYKITPGSPFNKEKWRFLYDAPFKISGNCCNVMKKNPLNLYCKHTGMFPIVATLAEESYLRKNKWFKHGCNAFDAKHPMSTPMAFWMEQDVLSYIKQHNIQIAPVYGIIASAKDRKGNQILRCTGCERTGCVFCAFGAQYDKFPNRFQRLKETHPKLWDYCINGKLNMKEVLDFIGVPYE